jgi:hypothetical protein
LSDLQKGGHWLYSNIDRQTLSRAFAEHDLLLFDGNKNALLEIMECDYFENEPGYMSMDDFVGILVRAARDGRYECVGEVLNFQPWDQYDWHMIQTAVPAIWQACKDDHRFRHWFKRAHLGSWKNGIKFRTILERVNAPKRRTRSMTHHT